MAVACALLAAVGSGCGDRVARLDVGAYPVDYLVLVPVDENDLPTRVSPVYGLDRFGGLPELTLTEGERAVVLVGWSAAELAQTYPGFVAQRDAEQRVLLAAPPATPILAGALTATAVLTAAIPPGATVLEAEPGGRAVVASGPRLAVPDRLELVLPFDPEPCRDPQRDTLRAFGDQAELLPPSHAIPLEGTAPEHNVNWREFLRVIRIDDQRVVALAPMMLYLIHRGQPIVLPPRAAGYDPSKSSNAIPMPKLSAGSGGRGLAIDPLPLADGQTRRLLVARDHLVDGLEVAALEEFALDDQGLRWLTSTTVAGAPVPSHGIDVTIDAQQRVVLIGEPNLIATRVADGAPLVAQSSPIAGLGTFETFHRVKPTGDPNNPYLIATDSAGILVGDAFLSTWTLIEPYGGAMPLVQPGLASSNGEHWVAGDAGSTARMLPGQSWAPFALSLPPRFRPCTGPAGTITERIREIAVGPEDVYLTPGDCSALLRLRKEQGRLCTTVIAAPDGMIATSTTSNVGLDLGSDGRLTVGGSFGALLELP
jgi:hypothetical protein